MKKVTGSIPSAPTFEMVSVVMAIENTLPDAVTQLEGMYASRPGSLATVKLLGNVIVRLVTLIETSDRRS